MNLKYRLILVPILFVAITLLFEWFNGGVQTHHILQSGDMPGISNWWGLPTMAALSWLCIHKMFKKINWTDKNTIKLTRQQILLKLAAALVFGILLSICFTYKATLFLDNVLYLLLVLALLFPLYEAAFLLGFVVGMTVVFGAVIPTAFGLVIALLSLLLHGILYKKMSTVLKASR